MYFGIIEIGGADGAVVTKTGSVSRRGVNLDGDDVLRDISSLEVVFLVAAPSHTVVRDVRLPAPLTGRNLENALTFEVENLLPVPLSEVYWGYRRLRRDNTRFRIFALRRDVLTPLLEKTARAGLSCDMFIPTQIFSGDDADSDKFTPLQLMLNYLPGDPAGKNIVPMSEAIPPEMRPVRYRQWRLVYRALLLLLLLLAGIILVGRYNRYSEYYSDLSARRQALEEQLSLARSIGTQLAAERELEQKIADSKIGTASILAILTDLNQRLPEYMWLTGFTQNSGDIELTVMSTQDDQNLQRLLSAAEPLYRFNNLSKSARPEDGTVTYTVKLRSLMP